MQPGTPPPGLVLAVALLSVSFGGLFARWAAMPALAVTAWRVTLATLIVWGPLMIGGAHAMITGTVSAEVMWASLPYGLGVMTILVGKHIEAIEVQESSFKLLF